MNLPASFFPHWLLILSALSSVMLCGWAAKKETWHTLNQTQITSWLCCSVILLLTWQLKAQIYAGIAFHILGATALTLIAGPYRALLSMAALLGMDLGLTGGDIASWGLSFWLIGVLPVLSTQSLLLFAQNRFSPNLFVYIFVNCFAAGAISMWLFGIANCILLYLTKAYSPQFLFEEMLPIYFLMGWPEAFITGLNLTLLVIWRPEWVISFNDRLYLQKR